MRREGQKLPQDVEQFENHPGEDDNDLERARAKADKEKRGWSHRAEEMYRALLGGEPETAYERVEKFKEEIKAKTASKFDGLNFEEVKIREVLLDIHREVQKMFDVRNASLEERIKLLGAITDFLEAQERRLQTGDNDTHQEMEALSRTLIVLEKDTRKEAKMIKYLLDSQFERIEKIGERLRESRGGEPELDATDSGVNGRKEKRITDYN